MEDFGDTPVGLTIFDTWMTKLYIAQYTAGVIELTQWGTLDRDHWKQYFDVGYTPQNAFEEDLTCYGD